MGQSSQLLEAVCTQVQVWYQDKRIVWACCGVTAAVVAYKAYNSQCVRNARKQVQVASKSMADCAQALSSASDTVALITSDLRSFLSSNTDTVPQSLRQLNKLLQTPELHDTLQATVSSMVRGLSDATSSGSSDGPSSLDVILEAILSDRGRSLVGMAVGIASKNATTAFCDFLQASTLSTAGDQAPASMMSEALTLLTSDKGERVLSLLVTKSVKSAVSTYVDSTAGYNMYEDIFSSLRRQEHRDAVTEIMSRMVGVFCKEVCVGWVKARSMAAASSSRDTPISGVQLSSSSQQRISESTSSGQQAERSSSSSSVDLSRGDGVRVLLDAHPKPTSRSQLLASTAPKLNSLHGLRQQQWVYQVVQLAKEREVRSLALDCVASATREATRNTIETLMSPGGRSVWDLSAPMLSPASLHKWYATMMVAILMLLHFMSTPQTLLISS